MHGHSGLDDSEIRETERWRRGAACRNMDTELFFPRGETGAPLEQTVTAKAVCAGCPVRMPCLEFAMESHQEYGIFGGLTEQERRSLARRRARARRELAARISAV
ncbi:MAG: WhiB family transcriptional regulator [Actinomycetota bacterium]|nr:WhiB family transcriptional regulator [Actinomycetota bacterium]